MTAHIATAAPAALDAAGSSFIYPVMSQWTSSYYKKTGVKINYQPIGSGGGISQLKHKTISFAASDMPLTSQQLKQRGWQQFPAVMGGIVPVIHLQGVSNNQLVLSGPVLVQIYNGTIKKWNEAAIAELNPKLSLPNKLIILVYRSDGSGTTFNFTTYLSQVDPAWRKSVGAATMVKWPAKMGIGAKGNAGVASLVQTMPGSIGYVEYAYAKQNNMTTASLINSSNQTVTAGSDSFSAAAGQADWNAAQQNDFHLILTNQTGAQSWPIVATTYILFPSAGQDKKISKNNREMMRFFLWAFDNPNTKQQTAALGYVSIPSSLVQIIKTKFSSLFNKGPVN